MEALDRRYDGLPFPLFVCIESLRCTRNDEVVLSVLAS